MMDSPWFPVFVAFASALAILGLVVIYIATLPMLKRAWVGKKFKGDHIKELSARELDAKKLIDGRKSDRKKLTGSSLRN